MIEVMQKYQGVKAFFSTRENGSSEAPYGSLNVAFHVGDDERKVLDNHQYIRSFFSNPSKISYMNQIHSNTVCTLGSLDMIPSCDALISKQKKEILMVMVADCIPILFFDKKTKAIAAIHAGRKGTFTNIVSQTLQRMSEQYQSKVEDIVVSIGPHIHQCCYEVGEEIVAEAESLKTERYIEKRDGSFFLDMVSIIFEQLQQLGIKKESIEQVECCTCCHSDKFFSYRKEGQTGRFSGVIMLE